MVECRGPVVRDNRRHGAQVSSRCRTEDHGEGIDRHDLDARKQRNGTELVLNDLTGKWMQRRVVESRRAGVDRRRGLRRLRCRLLLRFGQGWMSPVAKARTPQVGQWFGEEILAGSFRHGRRRGRRTRRRGRRIRPRSR